MKPKVSICVPNLNTLPFLPERIETIHAQTLTDWELLIYDSYSDDGAWEYFQDLEKTDDRIRAWQGPREGTPGSWTPCLKEAKGEYVYIATSDDTMAPDFLEKTVAALDANPQCGLAHVPLRAVDEHGNLRPENEWWREKSLFARSSGDLISKPHVRKAPYDGLLHIIGETVYISITQLLIRRSLFEKTGYFVKDWGAPGDYAWDMRAGLVTDTVHVPSTWGGWRLHSGQATDQSLHRTPEYAEKVGRMIEDSLEFGRPHLDAGLAEKLFSAWQPLAADHRRMKRVMRDKQSRIERLGALLQELLKGSPAAREQLGARLADRPMWVDDSPAILREWIESELQTSMLEELPSEAPVSAGAVAS